MENFCFSAIRDMESKADKDGIPCPNHDDIKQSIAAGKNIVLAYAQEIANLANGTAQEDANTKLQNVIRTEVNKAFELNV